MKKYQIADFIFGIHMEESLEIPENFKKFLIDTDEEVQVEYFLEVVDKLPELDGECVSQRIDLKVFNFSLIMAGLIMSDNVKFKSILSSLLE